MGRIEGHPGSPPRWRTGGGFERCVEVTVPPGHDVPRRTLEPGAISAHGPPAYRTPQPLQDLDRDHSGRTAIFADRLGPAAPFGHLPHPGETGERQREPDQG